MPSIPLGLIHPLSPSPRGEVSGSGGGLGDPEPSRHRKSPRHARKLRSGIASPSRSSLSTLTARARCAVSPKNVFRPGQGSENRSLRVRERTEELGLKSPPPGSAIHETR